MTVRRADRDDLRRLCVTTMRAFHDDPVWRWIIPDDEEFFNPRGDQFRRLFLSALAHEEVWCTDDGVALAVWIPPGRPESTADTEPPPEPPPPDRRERIELLLTAMAEHTPSELHWYLQLLGTHPDWQRQGLGAALMGQMFERADADGCRAISRPRPRRTSGTTVGTASTSATNGTSPAAPISGA